MSLSAAVLDALIAAGATREQLVAAMKADITEREADEAARLEAKREGNRERQRRHRSRDVTPVTRDECDTDDLVSLDKETPQTPKEIKPIPCVRDTRARAKHPLPANWTAAPFKPDGQAGLIVAGKPPGWIERQLSKFKDHALQNRRLCADWDAAWRNWIKQADEYDGQQRTNPLGRNQPADGLSSTARAALRVFGTGEQHGIPQ